ncbi:MAG: CapA family protein [Blastocatellia bacterium]|nr:CapA family protein [Blastocatellia bacterium]
MSNRRWLIITALILSVASLSAVAVVQGKKIFSRRAPAISPPVQRTAASQETPNRDEITVAAVGDIMLGSTWPDASGLPPNDGADLLSEVAPILKAADLTFGNLEGPMIDGGASTKCPPGKANCYAFRVPTRYGKYLKEAGFDIMSLANNHALDFGFEGRASSKRVLDSLGIGHSGEVGDIARLTVKGKRVAVIAFATYGNSYNLNDLETAKRVVSNLVAKNDLVIISFHGGAEGASRQRVPRSVEMFFGENRGNLRRFSHAMIDIGADLIIGHGPHVVRGMEVYKDRLIAYSLGNFATYGRFNLTGPLGLSLILEARLAPDGKFLGGTIHPAVQIKPGGPLLDRSGAVIPVVRELSNADFGESAVRVDDDGKISPP